MNILMIPSWYRTKENPNAGVFFHEQAVALAKHGHNVDILFWYHDAAQKAFTEKIESSGINEYFLHIRKSRFRINRIKAMIAIVKFYYVYAQHSTPDVIHVQSYGLLRYGRCLAMLSKVPYVVTEHTTAFKRGLLSAKQLKKIGRQFDQAAAVYAVSTGLQQTIQPLTGKEVIVVPNLVSDKFFLAQIALRKHSPFTFVSIASLDHKKGLDVLIRSFSKTFRGDGAVILNICGKGPDREELQDLAVSLGVDDQISFLGELSRDECVKLLGSSDAFVLPSRVETFGIVFGEAMAMGLPIIMAKTDAYQDLVTEETGLVVDIDDVDDLCRKMQELLKNSDKYDGEKIRSFCKNRYSETVIAQLLTERYHDVVGSERNTRRFRCRTI